MESMFSNGRNKTTREGDCRCGGHNDPKEGHWEEVAKHSSEIRS